MMRRLLIALVFLATMLPDPRERPFMAVEEAGRVVGCGRSKSYVLARLYLLTNGTEGLPCVQFGDHALRVPTAALWRLAGLTPPGDVAQDESEPPKLTVVPS